jgi:hypothetical protein
MDYSLYRSLDREPVVALEAHVLARAYRAAWRALRLSEPRHRHLIGSLDLVIDFGRANRDPVFRDIGSHSAARAGDLPPATQASASNFGSKT